MNNSDQMLLFVALTVFVLASPALAATPCENLASLKLPDTTITLAQSVAAGGRNAPAATDCASVIVVSGSFNDARFSHGVAARAGDARTNTVSATNKSIWSELFMRPQAHDY